MMLAMSQDAMIYIDSDDDVGNQDLDGQDVLACIRKRRDNKVLYISSNSKIHYTQACAGGNSVPRETCGNCMKLIMKGRWICLL